MKNIAVIFAGGTGTRMSIKAKPKQFLKIYGKPIIIHTLEHFQNHKEIDAILVICVKGWVKYLESLLDKYSITKVKMVIEGGETALQSQFLGLQEAKKIFPNERCIVLLHDGVRPLINEGLISNCILSVKNKGSAITVSEVNETIVIVNENCIETSLPRDYCKFARAPQCFWLDEIYSVHKRAQAEGKTAFVDSCSMMKYYNKELFYVKGTPENIKITTPSDYYMAKAIIDSKENLQIFGLE